MSDFMSAYNDMAIELNLQHELNKVDEEVAVTVTLDSILWKHVRCQAPLLTEELLCLRDVGAELTRLRDQAATLHTMLQCSVCEHGVQNQHSVLGMCPTCGEETITELRQDVAVKIQAVKDAEREIKRLSDNLRGLQARYDGSQRALTKLLAEHTELSEEAERLRGIEAALLFKRTREEAVKDHRRWASSAYFQSDSDRHNAIADALEADA